MGRKKLGYIVKDRTCYDDFRTHHCHGFFTYLSSLSGQANRQHHLAFGIAGQAIFKRARVKFEKMIVKVMEI